VGQTIGDVREVMIDGPAGVRNCALYQRPTYEASRRRLVWPNGVVAYAFSAHEPESLRGPQFAAAWCDAKTIWAGIISVMAVLSGFAGFPLDATTKNVLVENALQLVTAIAGIFAILGRISASTRISSSLNSN
jgi:phage terminase large subunit-like protein